jgi:hypothetical protein
MPPSSAFEKLVIEIFEEYRAAWLERAREAARCLGADGRVVTIDDVRAVCPPPEGDDPRVMGAVFRTKHWECLGYARSARTTCHNRPIGIYRLKRVFRLNRAGGI